MFEGTVDRSLARGEKPSVTLPGDGLRHGRGRYGRGNREERIREEGGSSRVRSRGAIFLAFDGKGKRVFFLSRPQGENSRATSPCLPSHWAHQVISKGGTISLCRRTKGLRFVRVSKSLSLEWIVFFRLLPLQNWFYQLDHCKGASVSGIHHRPEDPILACGPLQEGQAPTCPSMAEAFLAGRPDMSSCRREKAPRCGLWPNRAGRFGNKQGLLFDQGKPACETRTRGGWPGGAAYRWSAFKAVILGGRKVFGLSLRPDA